MILEGVQRPRHLSALEMAHMRIEFAEPDRARGPVAMVENEERVDLRV